MNVVTAETIDLDAACERLPERICNKIERRDDTGCWIWIGSRNKDGYGAVYVGRKGWPEKVHRVAYMYAYGSIPEGMHVLHRCDNPPCCNPLHLFLGTNADNVKDRDRKGRGALDKMTAEDARWILTLRRAGLSVREVASRLEMPYHRVYFVVRGHTWTRITEDEPSD